MSKQGREGLKKARWDTLHARQRQKKGGIGHHRNSFIVPYSRAVCWDQQELTKSRINMKKKHERERTKNLFLGQGAQPFHKHTLVFTGDPVSNGSSKGHKLCAPNIIPPPQIHTLSPWGGVATTGVTNWNLGKHATLNAGDHVLQLVLLVSREAGRIRL